MWLERKTLLLIIIRRIRRRTRRSNNEKEKKRGLKPKKDLFGQSVPVAHHGHSKEPSPSI